MTNEKKSIVFLKYAPSIMAITCALKIFLFYHDYDVICQYINIVLNAIIVYGVMICGKVSGYGKRHKFMCDVALCGYLGYTIVLFYDLEHLGIHYLTIGYLVFVLLLNILYRKI